MHQALRQWVRGDDVAKVLRTLNRHKAYEGGDMESHLFSLGRLPSEKDLSSLSNVMQMAGAVHRLSDIEARIYIDDQVEQAKRALQ